MAGVYLPSYWPLLRAYHQARAPLYRCIIDDLNLAAAELILDAGCGDGYYAALIGEKLGPQARIIAVDRNPVVLPSQTEPHPAIRLCQSDLERIGLRSGVFDAIWLCRVMHSAMDPVRWLAALARLLRPGGKMIVIENDLAHYPILAWPPEFDSRVQSAHLQYMKRYSPDETALMRYFAGRYLPTWLKQIGLTQADMRTYVSQEAVPMADDVEGYWRLVLDWLAKRTWPYLSDADRAMYTSLTDPQSPAYVLRCTGFSCMELTMVAWGVAA